MIYFILQSRLSLSAHPKPDPQRSGRKNSLLKGIISGTSVRWGNPPADGQSGLKMTRRGDKVEEEDRIKRTATCIINK